MTDKYAVIGHPISHSKSPLIHTLFAEQTGQDISYEAILSPLDGFAKTIQHLRDAGYKGCNITVPFKHEAYSLANEYSNSASMAHAVNTFIFQHDKIHGDNTDGIGLVTDIEKNLHCKLAGKRVLLMGAGGAAHGVIGNLIQQGANIVITNRNMDKAEKLAAQFSSTAKSYTALTGEQFDIVVNATSSSLSNALPQLPQGLFRPNSLAYDMMYGKTSPFLHFAKAQDVSQVSDGLGMLVEQAAVAFFKWRNVMPETRPVIEKLRG